MKSFLVPFVLLTVVFAVEKRPAHNDADKSKSATPVPVPTVPACAAVNPLNKAFYDLSELSKPNTGPKTPGVAKPAAWTARGFDYGSNFTIGICASPLSLSNVKNSHDIDSSIKNASTIGGYYTAADGIKYSIGSFNDTPVFRGRKMSLVYSNGSVCKDSDGKLFKDSNGRALRKSTILSFQCDKEILNKAQISFIGSLNDCEYFFEVRTPHACVTAKKADDLAAIWIFLFILFAALCVYFSGGFLYKTLFGSPGWSNFHKGIKTSAFRTTFGEENYSDNAQDTNELLDRLDTNLDRGKNSEDWNWRQQ